jgi:Icc-related predicted phosphoesterase
METDSSIQLLLFSDLHRDSQAATKIVQQSEFVDIVVGAGDFATVRRGLDDLIRLLRQIQAPTVLVAGNSETTDELVAACAGWPAAHVLHGNGVELDGIPFFGLGGAVPVTPFGSWSYDLTEDEARTLLADCPRRAVLVTHSPPKGAVDRSSSGASLGSLAVREAIERTEPRLVVCGHIHESAGQTAQIGLTPVINAGPRPTVWKLER